LQRQLFNSEVPPIVAAKVEAPKAKTSTEKPVVKEKVQEKVVADKKEVKAVIETKEPVKEPVKRRRSGCFGRKEPKAEETLQRKRLLLSIKIVGN
jgi:translation initiation factor IF-2